MWIEETNENQTDTDNLNLELGMSLERKKERRRLIGASDMPIIMGDSPYMTALQLWEDKTNRTPITQDETNFAQARGIRWEERVRKIFEKKANMRFEPKNFTHPENPVHSASLDGYNAQYKEGLEIKVTSQKNLDLVNAGKVPELYKAQVHWQIHVAGLTKNNFFCAMVAPDENGEEKIIDAALTVVYPDQDYINQLIEKADEFWAHVQGDTPPPLGPKDTKELKDPRARKDFSELKYLKLKLDEKKAEVKEYEKAFNVLKEQCLSHCDHPITACEGVKIQKIVRPGSIDTSKLTEEQLKELDKYKKPETVSYRVSLIQEDV